MPIGIVSPDGVTDASNTSPSLYTCGIAVNGQCGPNCPACCPRCGQGHDFGVSCPACQPVANDDPLGGPEVESAAEILAIYGDTLTRKDRLAFGWIDPDESAIEQANRTGRVGSQNQESGGYVRYQKPLTNVTARLSPKPDKPRELKCHKPQWSTGTDVYGGGYKIWHKCNKCLPCIANALNHKAWRWDVGRGPFQTSIMVNGAANADEARKWTGQLAKAVGIPNRASMVTDAGEIWIVGADPMDADTIERIRTFATARHGNCKRPAMQCTIKSETVKGSDLVAFVKGNRTAQGEQRHVSFRLHGAAFADDPVEDDFSLGDAIPIPDDEPTPTEVVLCSEVKQSRSWRKEPNPEKRESLRIIARADQARLWTEGKNIITYTGPTKMLKQYADYCAGLRQYEPAWDYVANLTEV